jgi:exopolysaccharide production protein ExoY
MIYNFTKRLIDFVGAFFGLMIFSPILLFISLAIRAESHGPAIFRQPRVTRGGKLFYMYKFRSMYVNADEIYLHSDPKLLKKFQESSWKLSVEEDPRVTNIGRFIRKTSLDELPQFWNVLVGDMSIVGPRAFQEEELNSQQKKFPKSRPYISKMLSVKPGITGAWQIGGRNMIDFLPRVKIEAEYADRRSLLYDLSIMLKTPLAVIHQEGAV